MLSELDLLLDVARRLEEAGLDYMLTGSMALNHYAQPRMTRDIDFVLVLLLQDLDTLPRIFGDEFYFSPEAAREAVFHQSCFNVIHQDSLIKIDFMIRKREDYRLVEFERRRRIEVVGQPLWIVSKEDLILSKLDWARQSQSERQLSDVENLLATGADMGKIPPDMVSKIEPDRYADTGFAVADTPADVNAFLFQQMMRKSGAERLAIGCRMTASARELVWSGIPDDLPEDERRARFLQRFYGDDFQGITSLPALSP